MRLEAHERVYLDSRRHGIVLVPALLRAFVLAAIGGFLVSLPSPLPLIGALLVLIAALLALRSVWRWERMHVVLTDEQLALTSGTVRRRSSSVRLDRAGAVELDQTLPGRIFGYATLSAGPLRITYVPHARSLNRLAASV